MPRRIYRKSSEQIIYSRSKVQTRLAPENAPARHVKIEVGKLSIMYLASRDATKLI